MTVLTFQRLSGSALLSLSILAGMGMSVVATAATNNRPNTIDPQSKIAIANADQSADTRRLSAANSTDGIIALVNDNAILKSDLLDAVAQTKRRAAATGESVPDDKRLQADVLNALILRELQLSLVNRIGLKPDENIVNARLAQIAQAEGLSSLTALQQRLDAAEPGSYAMLRQQIIDDASIQALQQRQIASRVRISEQDIDAFLSSPEASRLNQSEYQTIHIRVPYLDDYSRLSDQQRQQAKTVAEKLYTVLQAPNVDVNKAMESVQGGYSLPLQGGDMGYHKAEALPTQLSSVIRSLKVGEVSQPIITPEGIDIVKLAGKRSNESMVVPQWHTRHILVKVDELQSNELAEQKVNDLYEQLRRGATFSNLAATYSDDLGSAGRGGDLDWVNEGEMVPEFEQMMKTTPVGDFSTPFKSQFGWHILQVVEKRDQDISEPYRRKMAREALYQRLAPQAKEDWLQELRAGAYIKIFDE